jgi:hypothetical protein
MKFDCTILFQEKTMKKALLAYSTVWVGFAYYLICLGFPIILAFSLALVVFIDWLEKMDFS